MATDRTGNAVLKLAGQPDPTPEQIYDAYPRKVARRAALQAIRQAIKRLQGRDLNAAWLYERTEKYAKSQYVETRIHSEDRKFVPYPATWFNAERYDDDPEEWGYGVYD